MDPDRIMSTSSLKASLTCSKDCWCQMSLKTEKMTNEEFLLKSFTALSLDIEIKIEHINSLPPDYEIMGFDTGKIAAYMRVRAEIEDILERYEIRREKAVE